MATTSPRPIEFVVRGSFVAYRAPERATVRARLAVDGADREAVHRRLTEDLTSVRASIDALHDPDAGPVTWWSAGQVRSWSNRPRNQDGEQLPLVHRSAVSLQVTFAGFVALGQWIGHHLSSTDSFAVDGIDWALTAAEAERLDREVRARAVADAQRRAQDYADALGLGTVRPVAIADAGMLGSGLHPDGGGGPAMYARAMKDHGDHAVDLSPEDIEIRATVDARFIAD